MAIPNTDTRLRIMEAVLKAKPADTNVSTYHIQRDADDLYAWVMKEDEPLDQSGEFVLDNTYLIKLNKGGVPVEAMRIDGRMTMKTISQVPMHRDIQERVKRAAKVTTTTPRRDRVLPDDGTDPGMQPAPNFQVLHAQAYASPNDEDPDYLTAKPDLPLKPCHKHLGKGETCEWPACGCLTQYP